MEIIGFVNCVTLIFTLMLPLSIAISQQPSGTSPKKQVNRSENIFDFSIDSLHHPELGMRGAASCGASSCHGGPRPGASTPTARRGSEYALWKEMDPHAGSWRTLASKASTEMLTKLSILRNGKIVNRDGYNNCLACHNTTQKLTEDLLTPTIAEGVGCEMCHGPSELWYDRHYVGEASIVDGMTSIEPLVMRAKLCTLCHVGSRDRDMNHEIIAAGHPALYFDMAVYHEIYPKHWREKNEASPDNRARLWLAGQIAMADSELELMEARATKSHAVSTWPELALYRCTDCHVSLSGIPRAPTSSDRQRIVSGEASVRRWNLDGIDSWSRSRSHFPNDELSEKISQLNELLTNRSENITEVASVASQLRSLINDNMLRCSDASLGEWNQSRQRLLGAEIAKNQDVSREWESASRFYTAAWASNPRYGEKDLLPLMLIMRSAIAFPPSMQTPRFPRSLSTTTPPNFEQWTSALNQAAVLLMKEELTR